MTPEESWYEDGNFIRNHYPPTDSMGDLGFQNAHWAMIWKNFERLFACMDLLLKEKRWPDRMMENVSFPIAKNRWDRYWNRFMYWVDPVGTTKKFRPQNGMTRDPFTMFYCACVVMNVEYLIEEVQPMWYNFTPSFNAWRKYLITKKLVWKRIWEITDVIGLWFGPPAFSLYLTAWQANVAESSFVKKAVLKRTPDWNLCVRQLCTPPGWILEGALAIPNYKSRMGFMWQSKILRTDPNRLLPEGLKYYLDKQTLEMIYKHNLKNQSI